MDSDLIQELEQLFIRDLGRLRQEIEAYEQEADLWQLDGNISNCGGNLSLHLIGNLRHFVGHVLGESGYERKRDLEFSQKNVPKVELLEDIGKTETELQHAFEKLQTADLNAIYPLQVFGNEMTTRFFLLHLSGHLNYHLGQINYHRRLLR